MFPINKSTYSPTNTGSDDVKLLAILMGMFVTVILVLGYACYIVST